MKARFWVWAHNSPVKITLRPGETLRHYEGGRTDEGYHHEVMAWTFDGQTVERNQVIDGVDCDGRLIRHYEDLCPIDALKGCAFPDHPGIYFPEWIQARASQRDYSAEAMGY